MRLHRYYCPTDEAELDKEIWIHKPELLKQWIKVLRYKLGDQLILFNGINEDRQYQITAIQDTGVHLSLVTELALNIPKKNIYLFWSLLKKDKNDWVIQKCTELGVRHFIPIIADRSEKTGFNIERAKKIIIESSEQCGRSDIPSVREPMSIEHAIDGYAKKVQLIVADKHDSSTEQNFENEHIGVFVGPEGGWSENEKTIFTNKKLDILNLHDFTLRAETACVTSVSRLVQ